MSANRPSRFLENRGLCTSASRQTPTSSSATKPRCKRRSTQPSRRRPTDKLLPMPLLAQRGTQRLRPARRRAQGSVAISWFLPMGPQCRASASPTSAQTGRHTKVLRHRWTQLLGSSVAHSMSVATVPPSKTAPLATTQTCRRDPGTQRQADGSTPSRGAFPSWKASLPSGLRSSDPLGRRLVAQVVGLEEPISGDLRVCINYLTKTAVVDTSLWSLEHRTTRTPA